jgi:hypothetical protein
MPAAKQKIPPSRWPSRANLEARRKGVEAVGPSGEPYRIRKINMMRRLAMGNLPVELQQIALKAANIGADGTPAADLSLLSADDRTKLIEQQEAQALVNREENDKLVLATVLEPRLTLEDLGTGELDDDPLLPAVDYEWLVQVARGERLTDANGKWLWGPAPKLLIQHFRDQHECGEECAACEAVLADRSGYVALERAAVA